MFYDMGNKRERGSGNNQSLEIVCKWGRISRKLVKKHDGRIGMEARVNLARLARKLLLKNQSNDDSRGS